MSQILFFALEKLALTSFGRKVIFKKTLQHLTQILNMLFRTFTVNKDVVEEEDYKSMEKRPENVFNGCLKGGWGI